MVNPRALVSNTRSSRAHKLVAAVLLAFAVGLLPTQANAGTVSQTLTAVSDSHVSAARPTTNYGSARGLKVAGDPVVRTYLKFNVGVLPGMVIKATLKVYANNGSTAGLDLRAVTSSWDAKTVTWSNAPALSPVSSGRSGPFLGGKWRSMDVTSLVTAAGSVSVALVPGGQYAAFNVASSESGGNAPQLLVETATVDPTPAPTPAPTTGVRPYSAAGPWNTPIGLNPAIHPNSTALVNAIADNNMPLTSDPDQYTIPVYVFNASTPRKTVKLAGYFSSYDAGDSSRKGYGWAPTITGVPYPNGAKSGAGSDGQIVLWDPVAQVEYSFWQWQEDSAGNVTATNGYRYHTGEGYNGRFADGLAGRGAGTTYLSGLVRKWEVEQGRIDHALSFAYDSPSAKFVYPASKSDGGNFGGTSADLPEGARLQLNPALTDADFTAWGLSRMAKIIARALQSYGMIVIDHSGSSKVYLEDRRTAGWDSSVTRGMLSTIPWSQFRVINY